MAARHHDQGKASPRPACHVDGDSPKAQCDVRVVTNWQSVRRSGRAPGKGGRGACQAAPRRRHIGNRRSHRRQDRITGCLRQARDPPKGLGSPDLGTRLDSLEISDTGRQASHADILSQLYMLRQMDFRPSPQVGLGEAYQFRSADGSLGSALVVDNISKSISACSFPDADCPD